MLLKSSISNTKKFFQKTLHNFKSFFIPLYQKLPKTPPHNSSVAVFYNQSYKDLEKFYNDFTEQWDSEKEKATKSRRIKKKGELAICNESCTMNNANNENTKEEEDPMEKIEKCENENNKRSLTYQRVRHDEHEEDIAFNSMVEKKLKELEKLDKSNVDYVLDIEEVLHYYSRLTCPTYLEIVDKFFMEMCSEFFGPSRPINITPPSVHSRPKLRSLKS
ncbi:hypothetical protein RIF29_34887 [Crotalaria pallida]|uniref:OVATE domain-containing protein n=1 Tax=Crotalaria pallida TaxID=3830 RepID=A0AAN9HUW6_CROPI